jgi:putative peptidoglycan lipid II flippase
VRSFLKGFGPAVLGSTGPQIAMLADTVIATLLPAGSVSYLYYADRLYQLPLAVIGIAVGTVLLPELARRFAAEDHEGARRTFNRAIEGTLLLTFPFVALFVAAAAPLISFLFERGAFDARAVAGSALALQAYSIGLPAVIMLRPVTASFYARGDTATPVKALAVATVVNVGLKFALVGTLAHAGLALATSAGAWVNAAILCWLLNRGGQFRPDRRFWIVCGAALAALALSVLAFFAVRPFAADTVGLVPIMPQLAPLTLLTVAGWGAYGAVVLLVWLMIRRR